MAQIYRANGSIETVVPRNGKKFTIDEMQKFVGGYVQVTGTKDKRRMVCDEEGKLKGYPVNREASRLYIYAGVECMIRGNIGYDEIVGDVLIGTRKEIGM